ncbi:hypothetical protein BO86DRAFT_438927 [Aspergillus japonicus CBS 114.51]|uniref:2EXR domain-containing protein n=1 Tax=Aspergillus japonicus CBS 114.51 TaxID=1448312 RepID=A0A8T8XC54_ASPJA|nr:hypothetical protein BO86DRAFT_438927 [Aspergillus japonicus CBS 114.51]RAH85424.1 hypothetical protein BO86DRAFT_438927 [Aspergillus japonicus CBS 114.51]
MTPNTFPQFAKLPTELRSMIWEFALPDKPIGPFLYPYKPGYWSPRRLSAIGDRDDYSDLAHRLVDPVQFSMPLLLVNRQARAIAESWMDENSVQIRYYKDTESLVSVCAFHPQHDALYVSSENWEPFLSEMRSLYDKGYQLPRLADILLGVQRLAVPLSVLQAHEDTFPYVVNICPFIRKIFVVANLRPDLLFAGGDDSNLHARWELRKTEVARLWGPGLDRSWCGFTRGYGPGGYVADLIDRGADGLQEMFEDWDPERREGKRYVLRAVYAVRNEHQ